MTGMEIELNIVDDHGGAVEPQRRRRAGAARRRPAGDDRDAPDAHAAPDPALLGVRLRVWFGEFWVTSVFELFEENARYFPALPPICEDDDPLALLENGVVPRLDELSLHNDTIYAVVDCRPHLRVENRVLPAGPTVVDAMANAASYYGLVRALADQERPVWSQMSFSAAEENFHSGARYGIDATL